MWKVPLFDLDYDEREQKAVQEVLDSKWLSMGEKTTDFEKKFSETVNRKFSVAVSSGTAALDIAVKSLNLKKGDEVIVPAFTIISTVAQIVKQGVKPVLIDSDPITWNMNVKDIEKKITGRTKAIMVVHIYGLPVDMDPILSLADKYGLIIIEDAAEAHGLHYNGRICGAIGDISIFSFYPNKLITTGEGGMIVTDDNSLAEKCRSLRNLCFQPGKRFIHEELGWNFRMTNMQAALGLAQIERLDEFVEKKRHMGQKYTALLSGLDNIQLPLDRTDYAENIYWVYGLVLNDQLSDNAETIMKKLKQFGIGTRPFFWPMHEQPVLKKYEIYNNDSFPVAERIARRGFYIPSGLALTDADMKYVSEAIHSTIL